MDHKQKVIRAGRIIRKLRKERNWKQKELGERVGKSNGLISDIERGRGNFSHKTIANIAEVFGVPLSKIIGDKPVAFDENKYIEKDDLSDLTVLQKIVKEQPTLYVDGKEVSEETRGFFEDFLNMVVKREMKKRKYVEVQDKEEAD